MTELIKKLYGTLFAAVTCLLMVHTASAQQVLNGYVRDVDEVQQQAPVEQETPVPQPRKQATDAVQEILVVSKSEINALSAGKYLRHYENADAALSKKIARELQEHGLRSGPTGPIDTLTTGEHQHLLTYKIENLEFGFKNPFGRHTRLKVSYVFQKKNGHIVASGDFEEHSKKGWKNCVRAISEKIAGDVSDALAGKPVAVRQQKTRQDSPQDKDDTRVEERLEQLDALKAKGMVTPEEYRRKREEILGDL